MPKIKIDQADRYFSIWIRLRDKKCMRCGSPVKLNAKGLPVSHQNSHFKGRGKEATRFEMYNCDTLCMGCHLYFTAQPDEHYEWQVEKKGYETIQRMIIQSNGYKKKNRKEEAAYWKDRILKDYGILA
jgi:hypothetical protein